jgi:protocatechuate 3,4-dioxygenase beta subunit
MLRRGIMRRPILLATGLVLSLHVGSLHAGEMLVRGRVLIGEGGKAQHGQIDLSPAVFNNSTETKQTGLGEGGNVVRTALDGAGEYLMRVASPGVYRIGISVPGFPRMVHRDLALVDSIRLEDARFGRAANFELTTVDVQGSVVPGVTVVLRPCARQESGPHPDPAWRPETEVGTSNRQGKVRFLWIPGECASLFAFTKDYVAALEGPHGEIPKTVRLSRAPRDLVRLEDGHANPVPDAAAWLRNTDCLLGTANSSGTLSYPHFPTDTVLLTVRSTRLSIPLSEVQCESEPAMPPLRRCALPKLRTIVGHVFDSISEQPVAQALIVPRQPLFPASVTDGNGRFALRVWEGQPLGLLVVGAGHLDEALTVPVDQRLSVTIPLQRATTLEGVVTDASSKPIVNARILARQETAGIYGSRMRTSSREDVETVTDASGHFVITALSVRLPCLLVVSAPGFAPSALSILTEEKSRGTPLKVILERGRRIHGMVQDQRGAPVTAASVQIEFLPDSNGPAYRPMGPVIESLSRKAKTESDGSFLCEHSPKGRFNLRVSHPGYSLSLSNGHLVPMEDTSTSLTIVVLKDAFSLRGRATDVDGNGLPDVNVAARDVRQTGDDQGGPTTEATTTTGLDGQFVLQGLDPSQTFDVTCTKSGFVKNVIYSIAPHNAQHPACRLIRALVFRGTVTDNKGAPIPGVTVTLLQSVQGQTRGRAFSGESVLEGVTGQDGSFEFTDIAPGSARVVAQRSGYQRYESDPMTLGLADGPPDAAIVLLPASRLSGQVTDAESTPIFGAEVSIRVNGPKSTGSRETYTDEEGRFELGDLTPGPVTLEIHHDCCVPVTRTVTVDVAGSHLDIMLPQGLLVRGHVLREDSRPVAGAAVTARNTEDGRVSEPQVTNEAGNFEIKGLIAGKYLLYAAFPGLQLTGQDVLADLTAASVENAAIVLGEGVALKGRVINVRPDDFPLALIQVQGPATYRETSVRYDGSFEFEGLATGDYRVLGWIGDSGQSASTSVAIRSTEGAPPCVLDFGSGLTLSGRIWAGQSPVVNGTVNIRGSDVPHYDWARITAEGRFEFHGLPGGRYFVEYADPDAGASYDEPVDLKASQTIEIHVPGGTIAGFVRRGDTGEAISDVQLTAIMESGLGERPLTSIRSARTGHGGDFMMGGIAPGKWTLHYGHEGFASGAVDVTVTFGEAPESVSIALSPAQDLIVTVGTQDGTRIDRVNVRLLDEAARIVMAGQQELENGSLLRLPNLPEGKFRLMIQASGTAVLTVDVSVPGPSIAISLPPACTLTIRAPDLNAAAASAVVSLKNTDGVPLRLFGPTSYLALESWPMRGNSVVLTNLAPGSYQVEVRTNEGAVLRGFGDVAPAVANVIDVGP